MKFLFNDGGRQAAGFRGNAGDCVTRSIAIVAGKPYQEIYDALAALEGGRRRSKRRPTGRAVSARNGIKTNRKAFKGYMASLGFTWTPTMLIGSGCKVHLRADELPAGRLVVAVSKHYTAVVDGVIHDTFDPSASRGATIYPAGYLGNIPIGARRLPNGCYAYDPERCVYGYWTFTQEN